jgi:hypothetical protein
MNQADWKTKAAKLALAFALASGYLESGSTLIGDSAFAQEAVTSKAATVEAAAKVLDLRTLGTPEGAELQGEQHVGAMSYGTSADPTAAYKFQKQQLTKLGWKELPGAMTEAAYASGMFSKDGYSLSVSTSASGQPEKERTTFVYIMNFGNVAVKSLPVIKGATTTFVNEATGIYSVDLKVQDAADKTLKLLLDAGWQPYGYNDVSDELKQFQVKRNAIQIGVMVNLAPAQGNNTAVMYSTSLLAVDIPAPGNAEQLNFTGQQKTLRFESPEDFAAVVGFYEKTLPAQGWKPSGEKMVLGEDDFGRPVGTRVFTNAVGDVIDVTLEKSEDKTSAVVKHLSRQEIQAAKKKLAEDQKKLLAENAAAKDEEMKESDDSEPDADALANALIAEALGGKGKKSSGKKKSAAKASDAVQIKVPEGTKVNKTSDNVLQIKVGAGKGLKTAEFIQGHMAADGWEVEGDDLEKDSGNLDFKKDDQSITLTYVDTGFTDVMMMMIGIGTPLDSSEAEAPAKANDSKTPAKKSGDKPKRATEESNEEDMEEEMKKEDDEDSEKVEEPERVERPKQGISKMPKLPNIGSARMGEKSYELNQVIAYEHISQGEWRTKIVVSAKPVKQEKLMALLNKTGNDEDMEFPEPNIRLEIGADGAVAGISYQLDGVSGGGNSGTIGDVLVEDNRARGTLELEEEGEFFERTYIWKISFDTDVLTKTSKTAKVAQNLPKLENGGELTLGKGQWKLAHVVAYEAKMFDEVVTKVFISQKPINMAKLKASLAKDGTDDGVFETQPQVVLQIDDNDSVKQAAIWSDNASISSNADLEGDATVADGRVRGTAKLSEPGEFFGKKYDFHVSFDVEVMPLPADQR